MAVNLEQKVDSLESILGRFITHTDISLTRLEREMKEFKDEMKEFKDEMKEFKGEMRSETLRMNRQWGDLANKLGTIVEDLVYPSLARIIREKFDIEVDEVAIRVTKKRPKTGEKKEFDAIAFTDKLVFLNSTKTTLRNRDVDSFIGEITEFRDFFPVHSNKKIIGILAALNINDAQLKYAEKKGFLVIGVGQQLMEIKNGTAFKPKFW